MALIIPAMQPYTASIRLCPRFFCSPSTYVSVTSRMVGSCTAYAILLMQVPRITITGCTARRSRISIPHGRIPSSTYLVFSESLHILPARNKSGTCIIIPKKLSAPNHPTLPSRFLMMETFRLLTGATAIPTRNKIIRRLV